MLQPGRFVAQHVASSPFADRLYLTTRKYQLGYLRAARFEGAEERV